ncbi:Hint-domain [Pelomyxa schiedti]|nr:Hint-domain [Pelomyxa schiedti]
MGEVHCFLVFSLDYEWEAELEADGTRRRGNKGEPRRHAGFDRWRGLSAASGVAFIKEHWLHSSVTVAAPGTSLAAAVRGYGRTGRVHAFVVSHKWRERDSVLAPTKYAASVPEAEAEPAPAPEPEPGSGSEPEVDADAQAENIPNEPGNASASNTTSTSVSETHPSCGADETPAARSEIVGPESAAPDEVLGQIPTVANDGKKKKRRRRNKHKKKATTLDYQQKWDLEHQFPLIFHSWGPESPPVRLGSLEEIEELLAQKENDMSLYDLVMQRCPPPAKRKPKTHECVVKPLAPPKWEHLENGSWLKYDPVTVNLLNSALELGTPSVALSHGEFADKWGGINISLCTMQQTSRSGRARRIRYVGSDTKIRPYLPPTLPKCLYGMKSTDNLNPLRQEICQKLLVPLRYKCLLLKLPDDILITIFCFMVPEANCHCHQGKILAEMAAYMFCNLELVCTRFGRKRPDGDSLVDRAAMQICLSKFNFDSQELSSSFLSWKEVLLWQDQDVRDKRGALKEALHKIAFGSGLRKGSSYIEPIYDDERERARQAIVAKFGELDTNIVTRLRRPRNPCFLGDGTVKMAHGITKLVSDIRPGDEVCTESGTRKIKTVIQRQVNEHRPMVFINSLGLTPGHPVLYNGNWAHPFEIGEVVSVYVSTLYNFELEGGSQITDHSAVINGLVVCTLGKDCGARIREGWPTMDSEYGTGYWRAQSNEH